MTLQIGTPAPAFTLRNTETENVSLADYTGKNLVILFFPLAFTGVCTKELCSVRDDIATYNNVNAAVVGISVDSPFTLKKFKEEQNLNFPLLSDFNKTASAAYDSLYEDFVLDLKGVAKRSAFVVDASGNIQYAEVLASAGDLPNFEAIKEVLGKINS